MAAQDPHAGIVTAVREATSEENDKLDQWVAAKVAKDYTTADCIRAELRALGIDAAKMRPSLAQGPLPAPDQHAMPAPHVAQKRLCKRWARGEACEEASCCFRHTLLDASEEWSAKRARAQREAAQCENDHGPHGEKVAHSSRHVEFVEFVRQTFGDAALRKGGVLDIGGGRGAVSFELHCRLRIPCTLVDPRKVILRSHQRKYLRKNNVPVFPQLPVRLDDALAASTEGGALLRRCTLLGLHPDEATEAIVDAAMRHDRPFAVVPCCVFPSAFEPRYLSDGSSVRRYCVSSHLIPSQATSPHPTLSHPAPPPATSSSALSCWRRHRLGKSNSRTCRSKGRTKCSSARGWHWLQNLRRLCPTH